MCRYLAAATPPTSSLTPPPPPSKEHFENCTAWQNKAAGGVLFPSMCGVVCVSQSFGSPGACSALCSPGGIHIRRGVNSDVWLVGSCETLLSRNRAIVPTTTTTTRLRSSSSPCVSPGLREYHHGTPAIGSTPPSHLPSCNPPSASPHRPREDRIQTRHPAPKLSSPLPTSSPPSVATPKKGCRHHHHPPFPRVTHTDAPCGGQLQVPLPTHHPPSTPPELVPGAARADTRPPKSSVSALSSHARPP